MLYWSRESKICDIKSNIGKQSAFKKLYIYLLL